MTLVLQKVVLPLSDFALTVSATMRSQVTALCGPSGAGKTSLLDLIAGLRKPAAAFLELDGRVLTDTATRRSVPARQRQIGYVPQDQALFPHLSVRQNLLYGHRSADETSPGGLFSYAHVTEVLEIGGLANRGVHHLSGGEKQRVALARALLTSPRLLLLDEPLANLDAALKARIINYLTRVRDEFRVPMLFVTHDFDEIRGLCDEAIRLERGQIVSPSENS